MTIQARQHGRWSPFCRSGEDDGAGEPSIEALDQALMRLVWLEQKRLEQTLAVNGLTVAQFFVLASIWQRHSGCYMGELAGAMLQSSATMTGVVERLVRLELVQRQAVPGDRRVILVALTDRGRDLLGSVRRARLEQLQHIVELLPEDARADLLPVLRSYVQASESLLS